MLAFSNDAPRKSSIPDIPQIRLVEALNDLFTPPAATASASSSLAILRQRITHHAGNFGHADGEAAAAKSLIKVKLDEHAFASPARAVVSSLLPLIEIVEREARLRDDDATARILRWLIGGEGPGRELAVRGALAFALTHLQIREIDALLSLWPDQPHDAASNLRRSATLREIGWIKESYAEISGTVGQLRSMGSARRRGVGEASREAWAFYLYADLLEANKEKLESIIAPHLRNLRWTR
jgi:hypothetical protein